MHPRMALREGIAFTRDMGIIDNQDIARRNHYVLPATASLYIAESIPEVEGLPSKSGLAGPTHAAFYGLHGEISKGRIPQSRKQAIDSARLMGVDYLIYPALSVWDQDVGTWVELQGWRERRNLDIQDPLPDPALITEQVRAKQVRQAAEAREQAERDQYYRWREAQSGSPVELWKVRYEQSREKLDQLGTKVLAQGTDSMQWAHEQLRSFVLWLRSREYADLGLDQIAIRVEVIDARSAYPVESALITADSGMLTFIGDTPHEIGSDALQRFAQSLSPRQHSRDASMARYSYF